MNERNKNRPGYKDTKVGWIPDEWEHCPIGHISIRFSAGVSVNSENRAASKGKCGILKTSCVSNGSFRPGENKLVKKDELCRLSTPVKKDSVIISRMNTPNLVGANAFIPQDHPNLYLPDRLWQTHIALPKMDYPKWFGYMMGAARTRYEISARATGTSGSMKNVTQDEVRSIHLPRPPLPEQEAIAEVLSCWGEGLECLEKLIEAKKLRKKGLMQQLLTGTRRLPGFRRAEDGGQKSEYRFFIIPFDWKLPQIRKVAEECTERNRNGAPVTVLSCSKHRGFVESSKYFGKQIFSDDTSNYKVIHRGEFGFPSNHIEEGSIGLLRTHDKGIVSPIYTVFKTNNVMLPEYLIALFKTETYRHIFEITTNGSVDRRGSLRWNDFKLIKIPQPSLEEQKAIAAVLETADEEIRLLEAERDALSEQKKGLMQKR